jgi:hypothetical protein
VEYREAVHPFEEVIELTAVPGVSERMVRNIEDRITVGLLQVGEELDVEDVYEGDVPAADLPEQRRDGVMEPVALEAGESIETEPLFDAPPPPDLAVDGQEGLAQPEPTIRTDGTALSPALVADLDRRARRRGCVVLVLGGLLGAVVGSILTLSILAALNRGTLSFSRADARLDRNLQDARQAQQELIGQMEAMDAQLQVMATRAEEMAERQLEADESLTGVQQSVTGFEQNIESLETTTNDIGERLAGVAEAAEDFDRFLSSLRDLLFDLQGAPPTAEPTARPTETPSPMMTDTPEIGPTSTPTALPTSTGLPTRTPRPTATPFTLPTSTPEPQP